MLEPIEEVNNNGCGPIIIKGEFIKVLMNMKDIQVTETAYMRKLSKATKQEISFKNLSKAELLLFLRKEQLLNVVII